MLIAGSDDGVHRLTGIDGPGETTVETVFDPGPVVRVREFEEFEGAFAATETGLFHSPDGDEWTNLDVPREKVYAVGASPDGRLYAGTRPAHVYVSRTSDEGDFPRGVEWRELEAFRELPSRDEWRLPRHENLAQVRDLDVHSAAPDRVVAGVEVGGVHVSDDGGETWTERREGVDDDVHELHVVGPDEFVAATGFGLFRTVDAGRSWTRLDDGYEQRYFRSVFSVDGDIYAGGALAHTATWDDEDADPALFVCRDGETVEPVEHPRPDETITGMTAVDGAVVAATHRGTVLVRRPDGWAVAGSLPVSGQLAGSYTPLLWFDH
ncbi:WD40/YVTN/BNR-like repeat-containing protein [Halorussus salinisoli]|uniref:WD40/YVTN/BNR-like repeat-containing protein n=1 Tax=Halorussus salinisoli TaxID=2558242 RepID=UPI0010C1924B|nr:WD40 repeat domain-containing protein [Halorussus salinisoli]